MIGTELSHFRITAKLGEGGMGEVYRAEDTKLGREVAIKVLAEAFVADPERLGRFEREAKVLASLNHPHIAGIFEVGEEDGIHFLVMELAPGETLAERIARGAIPVDDVIDIALQIARGLEAAHERGIVHRDLKPGNVMVDEKGGVKILDFGLAKALEPEPGSKAAGEMAQSPTLTYQATAAGALLGTAAYMSPEQARGEEADRRADIWSFGVVVWEMLTGSKLFEGRTVSDTLAGILRDEIDVGDLPSSCSPALRRLLRRCLVQDSDRRLHDIADARIVLDEIRSGVEIRGEPSSPPSSRSRWLPAGALALGFAIGIGTGWLANQARIDPTAAGQPEPIPTFRQLTRLPGGESGPSLSADGEWFVFVKRDGGDYDIFSQRVDGTRALNLTESCELHDGWPAISPDGRFVAYGSNCGDGGIFVMGATGENVRRVSGFGYQPAWSPDGTELAVVTEEPGAPTSRSSDSELWIVRVADGTRRKVGDQDSMGPSWSPDGSRIAVWGLRGESVQRDLFTVPVAKNGGDVVSVVDDPAVDWAPVWSADGRWIYHTSSRGGTLNLWRSPVEPATGASRGPAEPLTAPSSWVGRSALSADGRRLVYTDVNFQRVLYRAPFDPESGTLPTDPEIVFEGSMTIREQRLSPTGDQIVFANEEPPQQLHLIDGDGSDYRQLTMGTDRNRQGAWSPDGEWIVYQTNQEPRPLVFVHPDGSGRRTFDPGPQRSAANPIWSPEGNLISVVDSTDGSYLIDVSQGLDEPEIIDLPRTDEGHVFWPTGWSTDGSRLVGRTWHQGGSVTRPVIYSLETGDYRPLDWIGDTTGLNMRFVDEHRIVFCSGNRLLLGDLRTETATLLYEAPERRSMGILSASADGRWLSWAESTDESDIWLLSLEGP